MIKKEKKESEKDEKLVFIHCSCTSADGDVPIRVSGLGYHRIQDTRRPPKREYSPEKANTFGSIETQKEQKSDPYHERRTNRFKEQKTIRRAEKHFQWKKRSNHKPSTLAVARQAVGGDATQKEKEFHRRY